jgi:hypothetical protein
MLGCFVEHLCIILGVFMIYYVMLELSYPDRPSYKVMYPFDTEKELVTFKEKIDSIFNDTYCDNCERIDPDDCSIMNEGYL